MKDDVFCHSDNWRDGYDTGIRAERAQFIGHLISSGVLALDRGSSALYDPLKSDMVRRSILEYMVEVLQGFKTSFAEVLAKVNDTEDVFDEEEYEDDFDYLDDELSETQLRLEATQLKAAEILLRTQNTIICLSCDSEANDSQKVITVDYNIGYVRECLLKFSKGHSAPNSELCISDSRNESIITGPIYGLPDTLVPGARVLLRVELISEKPEYKFIFEQQIFPDPKDEVIRNLNDRISQLEDKLFTIKISE